MSKPAADFRQDARTIKNCCGLPLPHGTVSLCILMPEHRFGSKHMMRGF
jgi:uncharacterized GH25 family protein